MVTAAGAQEPIRSAVPEAVSSRGVEAVELAESVGLSLDLWQRRGLEKGLGVRADGTWAALEVGVVAPRQNGKNAILLARELASLYLFEDPVTIHSAHQVDTSLEHFRDLLGLIENSDDLRPKVRRVRNTNGQEEIELLDRSRIRFRTRSRGGGRGWHCDCLVLDEAMFLPEYAFGALRPTVSAQPNPQIWFTGSAVDQLVHENGVVLARVRDRSLTGEDPRLAYFEWAASDVLTPDEVSDELARDAEAWARANPALGIRIKAETIENERQSMDHRTFAVERLGIGDWPVTDGSDGVISMEQWQKLIDPQSRLLDPVCLAFDVTPSRSFTSIAAAGVNHQGLSHVEVVDRRRGTGWLVERLEELQEKHHPSAIVCDAKSPAASLVREINEALGVEVRMTTADEQAKACGMLIDMVEQEKLRHLGTPELTMAVKGAARRPLGDAWAWSRRSSAVDISPLVASTLALWGAVTLSNSEAFLLAW